MWNSFDEICCFSYISVPQEGAALGRVTAATGPGGPSPMAVPTAKPATSSLGTREPGRKPLSTQWLGRFLGP